MATASPAAFITGIAGQDGSYLAELLLERGYRVDGLCAPGMPTTLIDHLAGSVQLHWADLNDSLAITSILQTAKPDEFYHLAARTFVAIKPEDEPDMLQVNTVAVHSIQSALRQHAPECRFVFAASSEIFGRVESSPQNEDTPIRPRNFYGVTKSAAYLMTQVCRVAGGMHASNAILYNHESPRRGEQFVTRKITRTAARIKLGLDRELRLGNLDAVRDWGHAKDTVEALHRIARHDSPDDYVVATGKGHTVRDFAAAAFAALDLDWEQYVVIDPALYRPAEPVSYVGDAAKARRVLGWQPSRTFEQLVAEMACADLALLQR